ncbi:Hypothetical protein FKW44_010918 [Caligus rogercresseyi]|uniref:Uncharacterized protein n=1 Tax=Caligus rogercresseyi TaxID=217165 RepID=A0A7T8K8F0_CALRO|nr:Hypothetical protein FKW44_010918 [Caligus rogercresseyi]
MTILGSQSSQQDGSKMLTEDHKMKRVRCAQAFLKLNFELGLGVSGQDCDDG